MRLLVVMPLFVGALAFATLTGISLFRRTQIRAALEEAEREADRLSRKTRNALIAYQEKTGRYPPSLDVLGIPSQVAMPRGEHILSIVYTVQSNGYTLDSCLIHASQTNLLPQLHAHPPF